MKIFRKLLLRLVGLKGYLILTSRINNSMVSLGFLRKKYPDIFYLSKIIQPGFVCLDLGAGVGYYSCQMSKLSGTDGKIYSIEANPMLADVLKLNLLSTRLNNVTVILFIAGHPDKLFSELPRLDFIRCSLPGSEFAVVVSMKEAVAKFRPLILFNMENFEMKAAELFDFFSDLNYKVCRLSDDKLVPIPAEQLNSPEGNVYFVP